MHTQDNTFPICQIIGYKNAGKTSLMEKLITYFASKELKVGAIKHHGHGGEPNQVSNTDSQRHYQAGAAISGVQGETELQLTVRNGNHLENVFDMYRLLDINILLMEGFKQEAHAKVVILREKNDADLLNLSNVIAVGLWSNELITNTECYTFSMHNIDQSLSKLAAVITDQIDLGH